MELTQPTHKPFRKILELCMETPCRCPSEGHQDGGRNVTETCLSLSFASERKVVTLELRHIEINTSIAKTV